MSHLCSRLPFTSNQSLAQKYKKAIFTHNVRKECELRCFLVRHRMQLLGMLWFMMSGWEII